MRISARSIYLKILKLECISKFSEQTNNTEISTPGSLFNLNCNGRSLMLLSRSCTRATSGNSFIGAKCNNVALKQVKYLL